MADLVLGLAKSAVEGTLTAAKSAIEEEEKLKKSMQRNLMIISDEFEMMRSFLNVAKDRTTDEMVRTLVRQVRNMALEVEDCIESAVLVDVKKSNWWSRLLLSRCMLAAAAAPAAALDDAVTAIELLKSRVEAMGQRNDRYMSIVGDSGSKPSTENTHQKALADAAALGILNEARDAKKHGRAGDLIQLIKNIDDALPLQVISVWGAAGDLGVASIIKKTCDDPEICKNFRFRACVKLMHPFNSHEFIRSLLLQFCTNYSTQQGSSVDFLEPADVMIADQDVLIKEFMKRVSHQRYLVFLEDVPSTFDWEAVRVYLPDKKKGSCIVVHAQQLEVASLCVGQSNLVLELEQFSPEHSVFVFFNEAKKKHRCPRNLIELIKEDADRTPLRIVSVYKEVDHLEEVSIVNKTCDKYPEICEKFKYRASMKLMHPFNLEVFIKILLTELCENYCPQHGTLEDLLKLKSVKNYGPRHGILENLLKLKSVKDTEGALIKEFAKQLLSNQRYLIFLEDLSSKDDLEAVRDFLPDNKNGSCVVVHIKQLEVARLCVRQAQEFSADHSGVIFFNEVCSNAINKLLNYTRCLFFIIFNVNNCTDEKDETEHKDEEMVKQQEAAKEWFKQHESEHVGRSADIENLRSNKAGVRSVFGMAGVGKSYIVKHVYYKQLTSKDQGFKKFGWVDVSNPFNIRDFSWRLLLDLHSGSLQHGSMLRIRDPIQECSRLLKDQPCLIVIDGLQSREDWDTIKAALAIEDNQDRSRIIVIANEESVASHCSPRWWSVEGLEIDDALKLFIQTLSRPGTLWSSRSELSPAEIETLKPVLHKCGGLPKLIVAVAEFIAREGWTSSLDYYFMQMLQKHQAFSSLRDLFSWVDSYFQSCPDSLKPCIFYLSIFPANHNIRRRRLVRRWIAEGYSKDGKENTAEEEGGEFFTKLCHRNMVQVPGSTSLTTYLTRVSSCHVNGFFREYIMSRSMEENLVFALEGHCSVNTVQHTGRHLTIGKSWDRDKCVYRSIDLSRLRSLTVFGKWESFFISDKMTLVRVLDLEDASSVTDADLLLIVKLLPRLKFLSLRRCKDISHLPNSIGDLRQLQTLDIRHTSIVKLPLSITMLQKLQHISAGTTVPMEDCSSTTTTTTVESLPPPPPPPREVATSGPSSFRRLWRTCHGPRLPSSFRNGGIELPRGIGKMTALHSISVLDVSIVTASGGRPSSLEELKNLTQLHRLGVSGVNGENCKELCSAISGHPHLESLSVWLNTDQDGCLDAISPPPEHLESLELYGHVGKLPAWTKLLSNLRKMKLRLTMIAQDELDLLTDLPRLQTLCLCSKEFQHDALWFVGWRPRCFHHLQVLEIACNVRLKSVTFEKDVMGRLEVLKIHCSNNVSYVKFSGLKELRKLREVSLNGSYDDKIKNELKSQLGEHPSETKPVLKSDY
ncbi:hypothetical protein U9M48_001738 [Paspalum notatum var. saurae]|uniref:Disease resistance protein RPM1 n=1 Tax=Paspalum notatum var. saurae TaxID=547442 RepID=A0AAQ3SGY3_PASNO